eukprot:GILJ01009270.1.p1 GENE.GILJ01009270.1~~GILJ01009270.1.p1  ORF type:complete len:330 (+),score=11.71 GILJ01009270.1:42-1031(+)
MSEPSSFKRFCQSIPLGTRLIVIVCLFIHVFVFLMGISIYDVAFCPGFVIEYHQYYRLVLAVFSHGSALHIFMNMLSFLYLGAMVEPKMGTLGFVISSVVMGVLSTSLITIGDHLLFLAFPSYFDRIGHCMVGFSGVIFSFCVLDGYVSDANSRVLFGFQIPVALYPWVLLFISQIIVPNASFLGHFLGIVMGFGLVYGFVGFFLPLPSWCRWLEDLSCLSWLKRYEPFKGTPDTFAGRFKFRDVSVPSCCGGVMVYIQSAWSYCTCRPCRDAMVEGASGATEPLEGGSQLTDIQIQRDPLPVQGGSSRTHNGARYTSVPVQETPIESV